MAALLQVFLSAAGSQLLLVEDGAAVLQVLLPYILLCLPAAGLKQGPGSCLTSKRKPVIAGGI
jgi:hypothetical protein